MEKDSQTSSNGKTFSYQSSDEDGNDVQNIDELQNNSTEKRIKDSDGGSRKMPPCQSQDSQTSGRRRELKDMAKLHAKDIIAFKINKKLAEQAAVI